MKGIILHRDGADHAKELFAKRQHVHDEGLEGRSSVRRVILFGALGTITKNTVVMNNNTMHILTTPTPLQQRAFDQLAVPLH